MNDLEIREASLEPVEDNANQIFGRAVPYDVDTNVGDYLERIERGAISDSGDIKLFWQHRDIIGHVIETEDREDGFYIRATVADTATGRDALALMRAGSVNKFSIGFVPVESRQEGDIVVRTAIDLKEVSAVTFPAYGDATITDVRTDTPKESKEIPMTDNMVTSEDLAEIRDGLDNVERSIALFNADKAPDNRGPEYRSAGALLKAIVEGDENAVRAYTGATTADSIVKDAWVGDQTRLVEGATTLYTLFSKGSLPSEGNNIEYGVLSNISVAVSGQANEGDTLVTGKLEWTTATAPVLTRGGYVELSRQTIERSSINVLDHSLRAQSIELGKDLERVTRAVVTTAVAGQSANAVTVADGDEWTNWQNAVIDASVKFKTNGLSLDVLVVSTDVFKRIANIAATDGRPIFTLNDDGSNTIGTLTIKSLTGQIFKVTVVLDALSVSGKAYFANVEAVRIYTNAATRLSDEEITNLTKTFAVYQYIAVAPEIPAGLVPITITA